ncbi:MAG: bifunctional YncE family protein/alkaline phosphatase family protein [Acidimicrobiales bacterium]
MTRRSSAVVLAVGFVGLAMGLAVPAHAIERGGAVAPGLPGPLAGNQRLPNGWRLHPAGTQILTQRGPTGLTSSPNGKTIYAATSGIFEEAVESVDATTLTAAPTLVGSAFQGVAADSGGHVFVSGGPANAVFSYEAAGPGLISLNGMGPAPSQPSLAPTVANYPGAMALAGSTLYVAGTLSEPEASLRKRGGPSCPASDKVPGHLDTICSVVTALDVSNPVSPRTKGLIAVGRDAFGLAWRPASHTLYVSNFADQTDPARGGHGTVSVVQVDSGAASAGREIQAVPVGDGPAGIALSPDGRLLVVADSASDQVSVLPVAPDGTLGAVHQIDVRLAPDAPLGTSPLSVAFSSDGRWLYTALAGLNAVEVFAVHGASVTPIPESLSTSWSGRTLRLTSPATYVPTGWYPDALAVTAEPSGRPGSRLYVANLRGNGAGPGLYEQLEPLVGSSTEGTLSAVDIPADPTAREAAFRAWTATVVVNDAMAPALDRSLQDPARDACLPVVVPGKGKVLSDLLCSAQHGGLDPSAVHVVTILAENKTFDAYFGDTASSLHDNGSPIYSLYPAPVTTNQHRLAAQFTLSDNFWNEGAESSVLGHSWWAGGITTPDNELTWGQSYDQGLRGNRPRGQYGPASTGSLSELSLAGPSDPEVAAAETTMLDPPQVLADEAGGAGRSVRVFGTDTGPPGSPSSQNLVPQTQWGEGPQSPVNSDLGFPDVDRANIFLHGITTSHAWNLLQGPPPPTFGKSMSLPASYRAGYTLDGWTAAYRACMARQGSTDARCQGASMPNYTYLALPENHTYVVSNVFNPLDPTPQSMVADNDAAIGRILDGLSHSPFWSHTIVFISEDDNQFTGDHVDIHRTFLLTAGGLARQLGPLGQVSHQPGSFASVLKTSEVLLGLKPLTLFDWMASPLQDVVANRPGNSTYQAVDPAVPFLGGGPLP